MQELFYSLLDASFYGSIVILVIFALRLFLKNAPKNVLCLLWLLAALRLLVPFEIESRFSLQPDLDAVVQTQSGQLSETVTDTPIVTTPAAPPSAADTDLTPVIPTAPLQNDTSVPTTSETTLDLKAVLPWIWLAVATGLAIYSILSYFFLKRRVRSAVPLQPGVYECAGLHTAFVLGFLRPRIYLPAGLSGLEKRLVLAHERAHLRRGDHWWKLLGFLTAALHWFNPLVWVAYGVLCRDIEMACDARVIRSMDLAQRKAYSTALLN